MINQIAIQTLAKTPFTQIGNFTGQPAMNVPLQWDKNGMPCGVQFIAPFGDEATLFRLASQLEKAKPWFDKRPSLKI
jgi:amidase